MRTQQPVNQTLSTPALCRFKLKSYRATVHSALDPSGARMWSESPERNAARPVVSQILPLSDHPHPHPPGRLGGRQSSKDNS